MLSVIIVNYNVKYFLEQCLHSVQKAMAGIPGEIIVVDNHSTDGSLAYLMPLFPSVQFIANAGNPGFSKANNQGWRIAKGDHILFLNPDTLLSEDSLQQSLALMEQRPDVGALGIRMVDGSGRYLPESKRGTPTPAVSFYKLSGLIRLFPHSPVFARYYLGHLSPTENHEVEVLAGAYMLVKRNVLEATGGFDERFFMYGEDVDLSYRIRQLGFKNWYLADSTIIHFKGESTKKDAKYVTMFYKAMALFVEKHYGKKGGAYSSLLQAAIRARMALSFIGSLFPPPRIRKTSYSRPVMVIGAPQSLIEVSVILKENNYPNLSFQTMDSEEGMHSLIARLTSELIYCPGPNSISYTFAIRQMQLLPPRLLFRFHAAGSRSIVGSQSKNAGGDAIGGEI